MLTDELVAEIKGEEGFVPVVYLDAKGKKTIGYGTLLEEGISEAEAELLLRHRLSLMERELENSRVGEVYENLRPLAKRAVLNMATTWVCRAFWVSGRCGPRSRKAITRRQPGRRSIRFTRGNSPPGRAGWPNA